MVEKRRNTMGLLSVSVVAALVLVIVAWLEKPYPTGDGMRWVFSIVQVVAVWVGFAVTIVALARVKDELVRKVTFEAAAIAFIAFGILVSSYAFLRDAGLPELEWAYVWPIMLGLYLLSSLVVWRRYR